MKAEIKKNENGNIENDKEKQSKEIETKDSKKESKESEISQKSEAKEIKQNLMAKKPKKKEINEENEKNKKEEKYYKTKILSDKNNNMEITIGEKENNLILNCFYIINFTKVSFYNKFSLEELKNQSNYYKQFNDINQFINELIESEKENNNKDINKLKKKKMKFQLKYRYYQQHLNH